MGTIQKTILIISVLLVTSALIGIAIIYPTINDIRAYNERIQAERVALENKYTNRRNIKNIIADLKYVGDSIGELFNKMIITKGEEVKFISSLEEIAGKYQVVQKITLGQKMADSGSRILERFPITITLSGNFIDIIKYIAEIEKMDYYVSIVGINATSAKDASSKNIESSGEAKILLKGYVYISS